MFTVRAAALMIAAPLLLAAPALAQQGPAAAAGSKASTQAKALPTVAAVPVPAPEPVQPEPVAAAEPAPAPEATPAESAAPAEASEAEAAPVQASTRKKPKLAADEGWNADWALLFHLNNIFVNPSIISSYSATGSYPGIGAMWFLKPDTALRGGIAFGRTSSPRRVTKTVSQNGGDEITTYTMSDDGVAQTSSSTLGIRADYLHRLLDNHVAPYVGGGLFAEWTQDRIEYKDEVSVVDQVITQNDRTDRTSVGVRALLGAEWRLHGNFALFAEYAASLNVFTMNAFANERIIENGAGDTKSVSRTTSESTKNSWLQLGTGLAHGAQFGLSVHF